jgi:hypothetical protein
MDAACYRKFGAKDFCYNYFTRKNFLVTYYHNYLPYIFYSNIFTIILGGIAHNAVSRNSAPI